MVGPLLLDRPIGQLLASGMSRGASTRKRILQGAIDLMGREGPDGFTASALAAEVGVSKSTLFHHFAALDEIPLAALEEKFFDAMRRAEDIETDLSGYLSQFAREMRAIVSNERFLQAYFAFFVKGMFDERFRARVARGGFQLHEEITESLASRLGPSEEPEVAARLVEVVLDGLALHHLLMRDHDLLDHAWERFADLLVAAQDGSERP
jgi:AcrR family transcriptional regulator